MQPDSSDPWSSLADSLGVPESAEPRASQPAAPKPPARPHKQVKPSAKPSAKPAAEGGWSSLASELGLGSDQGHETSEHRPARPAAPPPRAVEPRDGDGEPRRAEPREGGEERGRRRRGRRGGRRRSEGPREPSGSGWNAPEAGEGSAIDEVEPLDGGAEATSADGRRPEDESGEPRRRRRRGRRGGRRRRRGDQPTEGSSATAGGEGVEARSAGGAADLESDEPLPSGYGMPPAPSTRERRPPRESATGAAGSGERGRRRKRRGGRRRSDRGAEDRPSSRFRGARTDFAPVAGSFEEDDEGLEFLGLEEGTAKPPKPRREGQPDEEDVLAESGLAEVRDVPSWVEAIGIVIAGNLDARSRSGRDDRGHRG